MGWLMALAALLLLAILLLFCARKGAFSQTPVLVRYTLPVPGLEKPLRLALVTDLHSSRFGENQQPLLELLDQARPHRVLLGGDLVDDRHPQDPAWRFLEAVAARYPCDYVTGNHEWKCDDPPAIFRRIRSLGIRILAGETVPLAGNVTLTGVDDGWPARTPRGSQLADCAAALPPSGYHILLIHRPEIWKQQAAAPFHLTLSGHTHGGQWRIPGLLNGVFSSGQGLFPRLAGGLYEEQGRRLIVSRGLGKKATHIPRFFCPLEIVLAELTPDL